MNRMINTNDEMGFACGRGLVDTDVRIVCITTNNYILKDTTEVVEVCAKPLGVDADIDAVRKAVFGRSRPRSKAVTEAHVPPPGYFALDVSTGFHWI